LSTRNLSPLILLVPLALIACSRTEPPETSHLPAQGAEQPVGAESVGPEPDPITRPYDEEMARREAARLATRAFAEQTFHDAAGDVVPPREFRAEQFTAERRDDRWFLEREPPAGAWARVSFGLWGTHEEVEVGFAAE